MGRCHSMDSDNSAVHIARKEQTMSKKKPCGLDYCPQEEIVGAYASCSACAWGNDGDNESEEEMKGSDDE